MKYSALCSVVYCFLNGPLECCGCWAALVHSFHQVIILGGKHIQKETRFCSGCQEGNSLINGFFCIKILFFTVADSLKNKVKLTAGAFRLQ